MAERFQFLFLLPIYTRVFSPTEYGMISLIMVAMALVSILAVLGLDSAALRWYWETEDTADRKTTLASWVWCQIAVSSLWALLVVVSSGWLARNLIERADAGLYFQLAAIALPLSMLRSVVVMWFRMQRRPWATIAYSLSTNSVSILAAVVLVVILRQGLKGVFLAQIVAAAVSIAVAAFLLGDWINPWHVRWQRLREMLHYALPLAPAGLAFWIVTLSDRYFVQFYTSTSEVGLYQVGSSLAAVIALGAHAFQKAWPPFALSIHKDADAKQVYANVFLGYLWLACGATTALALLAPEVLRVVATQRYVGASTVVGLLALGNVMIGLRYIAAIGPAIMKTGWPVGWAAGIGAALHIALNFLLVPPMGKLGAAIATLLSQSAAMLYLFYRSQQLYLVPYRFAPGAGLVALSLLLMWLGAGLDFEQLWVSLIVKLGLASLFIPALFLFRVLTPAQAQRFLRRSPAEKHPAA